MKDSKIRRLDKRSPFEPFKHPALLATVIVAALGYFVDIYDLILFSIVRVQSLKSIGDDGATLFDHGLLLLNMQMLGMLVGGVFWGILGDKKGRLSVLFGSILTYSIANIANGFVQSIEVYAILRFIAGVGLAGELGAGITLVSEKMPKESRGIGTTIVASVGICGALLAAKVTDWFDWRQAYFIGGGLGLALLLLRIGVSESGLFEATKKVTTSRGQFFSLFTNTERFKKYLCCILVGIPLWYIVGILMTFAPEFAKELRVTGAITSGKSIMYGYLGIVIGDLASGLLSQYLKNRRKVVLLFLLLTWVMMSYELLSRGWSTDQFYLVCGLIGFSVGYWALFVTIAAEQFGTNIRSTVTTTVPNFVRGSVVPLSLIFVQIKDHFGLLPTAIAMGTGTILIALLALQNLQETFGKDIDYLEL